MSHPLWYTRRMIKTDMKENTKANNLKLGCIYINANTSQPMRLLNILPCEGAWLETYDGQGYGETVKFEDVSYASLDEVQDFLDDHAVFTGSEKAPAYKDDGHQLPPPPAVIHVREYAYGKEIVRDSDGSAVIGWYDDNEGNDIRCRD